MKQIYVACMMFLIASSGLMAQNTETKFAKTEKEKCKANYKLAAVNATAKEAEGFLLLQFDFDFEKNSDIPENGELLVKLVNCKGQEVHVKVAVKFDPSTGKAFGYQAIPQPKDCPLSVASISLQVKDSCGQGYGWCGKVESTSKGSLNLLWSGKHIDKGVLTC
ncbi:MAG TPA: hypothetical protein VK202_11380 [Bacteroidia bacterium]|nr:hypothetical protein [Bacteroidia bacterium]